MFNVMIPTLDSQIIFGNTVREWLTATGVFVGVCVVLYAFRTIVVRKLRSVAERTATNLDDAVVHVLGDISMFFYIAVALFIATWSLLLPQVLEGVIYGIFIVALVYEGVQFLQRIILFFVRRVWLRDGVRGEHISHVLSLLVRFVLWTIGALLILSNLGFEISSLVASLGIGGVAVALAVQNILGDVFSSFSIYFDRPFQVGDFIIVGDHMGTVKDIGLKTTRIQALQGEEIVISNAELTSTRIRNFKKMEKRRIAFSFGVTYDTPPGKLRKIPDFVREIVDRVEHAEFDRTHFRSFGDSSLDYEVVYFVTRGDYTLYMDTQQAINLGLVERFGKEGIEFAFPTRTVHVVAGDCISAAGSA